MGWIIFILIILLIAQSIRASNLKQDLKASKEITKTKEQYINILEETNKAYRQYLFREYLPHPEKKDNQKPN